MNGCRDSSPDGFKRVFYVCQEKTRTYSGGVSATVDCVTSPKMKHVRVKDADRSVRGICCPKLIGTVCPCTGIACNITVGADARYVVGKSVVSIKGIVEISVLADN
jgi:hypothetical protein